MRAAAAAPPLPMPTTLLSRRRAHTRYLVPQRPPQQRVQQQQQRDRHQHDGRLNGGGDRLTLPPPLLPPSATPGAIAAVAPRAQRRPPGSRCHCYHYHHRHCPPSSAWTASRQPTVRQLAVAQGGPPAAQKGRGRPQRRAQTWHPHGGLLGGCRRNCMGEEEGSGEGGELEKGKRNTRDSRTTTGG